ncbi:MAG: efflux RND transporter permease subunit [Ignavibacteriae bacterium]|nr:efflux RND transporter permease subunit [Ignavibacteriota bacterium]MCB9243790.1 efflux RND transporter permease subunit [Ignavibacteriales bacterium]
MSLSETSIKRPVLSIVMSLILIIFGIVAFSNLEVREYPSVDAPVISVTTNYPGANSDVIETQITEPLEESLNGIEGIKSITSESREQSSRITIEFELDRDLEAAANDVRDRVSRAQRNLPPDVENPLVRKSDADAVPIIFMFVQSDTKNIMEVSEYANNVIKERLQTITGVSAVNVFGEKKYSMQMRLNPQRLSALGLTAIDVQNALQRENVELPSGRIEGDNTELPITTLGRLTTVEDFNNLTIKEVDGKVVRFKDIGYAVLSPENERTGIKKGGLPGIGLSLQSMPGANLIEISDEFWKRYHEIEKNLPPEYTIDVGFDFSEYVRGTVKEVETTIFIAFGLVVMIIFLFLRDWRSTLIPIVAIPISIIATFFVMYAAGFSINVLTLMGIILAIGLVVDDAIVVLENIYSKIEEGYSPVEAAFKGSKEIYFAVIATTLALAAVFLPILFLEGLVGRLFREFGVTIGAAVIISSFVALSLTPMLCSRLLRKHDKENWFYNKTEPFYVWLNNIYSKSLEAFMKVRWMAFVIIVGVGLVVYFVRGSLQSELAPLEDRSNVRVNIRAPEGTTYEYTERYMEDLNQMIMDSVPEVPAPIEIIAPSFSSVGATNTGIINLYLIPPDERKRTQDQIYKMLNKNFGSVTGIRAFAIQPPTIGSRFARQPIQYVIQAPTYEKLIEVLPKFMEEADNSKVVQNVDTDLRINKPEIKVEINRDKASVLGVSVQDISKTLQAALGGQRYGYFIKDGKQYQVIGQVDRENRDEPYDLQCLYVRNKNGQLVQMDNLITLTESISPAERNRYNRFVSATVSANLAPGFAIGDGIAEMDRIAAKVLDPTFSTALNGESKDYAESSSSLMFTFIFALVIIFLVLAAQFESFVDPFIILLTVPLALTGAVLSLWIFGQTLNVFSQIGIIMLIGLVTKNAILIVEFANQRKELGLHKLEAVIGAAEARFRPILMTTLSTVLGILPIAVGAGAGSRVSLGIAVVGGLIFATFLTLFVVPAVYSYFSRERVRKPVDDYLLGEDQLAKIPD